MGPAGAVPIGLMGLMGLSAVIEFAVSDIFGVLGADKSSFLHPMIPAESDKAQSRA